VRHITVLIISSNIDPASLNIKNHLLKQTKWEEINSFENNPVYQKKDEKDIIMITINDRKITHDNLDDELKKKLKILPKQAIFISRHTSKTGEPTLTVHPIGNYGKAEFGGKNKTLVKSAPKTMTSLLRLLNQNAKEEKLYHKVCFEVTHHGPFLKIPTLFIEVGSTEEEWIKTKPGKVVAQSLLQHFKKYLYEEDMPKDMPVILGVGGGHYAPRFTDVALEKEVAFGHMVPRYQIEAGNINDEMLEQAIAETPNITAVYFHRKSLKKSQIREYKQWFESNGIRSVSSKKLPDLIL
jgi:D-aminoacyl-tRNA deacylase